MASSFIGIWSPLASDYPSALAFAKAFGIPELIRYQMKTQAQIDSGRSLNRQGVAAGKPTILVEIGQNGGRDSDHVAIIVAGLGPVCRHWACCRHRATVLSVEHRYYESTKSVPVRHSGIWHPV